MDLQLFTRVLWRFRVLVAVGIVLALTLAAISFIRIDFNGGTPTFSYRDHEQWVSRSTLLVTQNNFPLGRSVFEEDLVAPEAGQPTTLTPKFAPSSRFIELAAIYAQLATSDAVRSIMLDDGPIRGDLEATSLTTRDGAALPLLSIGAISTTPESAVELARRATGAFREYLETQQDQSGIPTDERVVLKPVKEPLQVELLKGRSKTLAVVAFATVMMAVIGIAFVLENLRPRVRPVTSESESPPEVVLSRRSA